MCTQQEIYARDSRRTGKRSFCTTSSPEKTATIISIFVRGIYPRTKRLRNKAKRLRSNLEMEQNACVS